MFELTDFHAFDDTTLAGRLAIIRRDLDPKFVEAGKRLAVLAAAAGLPSQTVHLAKHARRTKNPPPDTWLALAANPRGYKMMPHVELGFWDDRLFLWVALLQESKPFTLVPEQVAALVPADAEIAGDHTDKQAARLVTASALAAQTARFNTVRRGEWLVGKTYLRSDALWQTPEALWADIEHRFTALMPLYQAVSADFQASRA